MREEVEGIKNMFAPLNIPVTYTRRMQVDDSKKDSNEYEWGPEPLSYTSPKEPNDIIYEAQERIRLKLQT